MTIILIISNKSGKVLPSNSIKDEKQEGMPMKKPEESPERKKDDGTPILPDTKTKEQLEKEKELETEKLKIKKQLETEEKKEEEKQLEKEKIQNERLKKEERELSIKNYIETIFVEMDEIKFYNSVNKPLYQPILEFENIIGLIFYLPKFTDKNSAKEYADETKIKSSNEILSTEYDKKRDIFLKVFKEEKKQFDKILEKKEKLRKFIKEFIEYLKIEELKNKVLKDSSSKFPVNFVRIKNNINSLNRQIASYSEEIDKINNSFANISKFAGMDISQLSENAFEHYRKLPTGAFKDPRGDTKKHFSTYISNKLEEVEEYLKDANKLRKETNENINGSKNSLILEFAKSYYSLAFFEKVIDSIKKG